MTEDEVEGWQQSLDSLYDQSRTSLQQQGELLDRADTLIKMANVHRRRHLSLMKEAKDIERLLNPPKGPIAKLRKTLDRWKEERKINDGYPGI